MSSSLLPLLMAWSPCCGVSAYFVPTTLISTPPAFLKSCNRIWDQDSNRNSLMTKTCLSSTHVLGVKFKPSSLYMSTGNEFDSYVVDDFSQLTVAELKDRLRQLHLPVSGRKNDLFERLNEFYAGNANGETELENEPEPKLEENHAVNFDTGKDISSSTEEVSGSEDDPNNFTVAELKERLKKLGLPVGGRKVELIYRLKANTLDGEHGKSNETADEKDEGANPDVSAGNNKHDTANIDSLKGADNDSNESISLDDTSNDDFFVYDDFKTIKSASDTSENAFQRRARRKKYWKTQEVRELIRANNPSAIEKAEEMIATLEYMAAKENNEDYLPGPNEYTALIDAYATSGTSDAPARAEKIISRIMEANERSARAVVIPTASMSDAIMKAYANLGTREAAEQATAILNRMDYMREHNPNSNCKPSVFSYAVAISAWTRVGTEDAAKNAETILGKLFDAYDEVLKKGDQSGYVEELKPNSVAFNSVIDAWASSGSPLAGEKVDVLLERMKALSMLPEYDVRPDVISFNTCIKAWCNSNSDGAAAKAEEILSLLESHPQYHKRNGMVTVRPTRLSYNCVINAYAKSMQPDSAIRAQDLLMRMIKSFKTDTFSTIKPDVVSFSSVLNALAKSKTVHSKAEKCSAILKSMIDIHEVDGSYDTKPNIICYNTVLNACAFSAQGSGDERRQALTVAVETFNQMRNGNYASPDAVSYGNMLKCCSNLMPQGESRTGMASRLFSYCVEAGLVGGMVLDEIRRSMPAEAFLKLLAECGCSKPMRQRKLASAVQLRDLPEKWTINVKGSDMASRQRASFVKPKERKRQYRRDTAPKPKRPSRQIVETAWISDKNV